MFKKLEICDDKLNHILSKIDRITKNKKMGAYNDIFIDYKNGMFINNINNNIK